MKNFILIGLLCSCIASTASSQIRIATFNASLNRCLDGRSDPCLPGGLVQQLTDGSSRQGQQVAELIQRIRPDILLLNEFNFDPESEAIDLFQQNYLSVGQNSSRHPDGAAMPIEYPYRFIAPSNTGVHSGLDLDNNGRINEAVGSSTYANDSFGFGEFPGRYGMVLLSKYPIDHEQARTFQNFLWKDMPDALLPDDRSTPDPNDWYSAEELNSVRLSSKSHWDVPVKVQNQTIHLLASHPTPPVFDGPEDRNGRRNHDEIRFWADYVSHDNHAYIADDTGMSGGLEAGSSFVVLGDLNADPVRGDSFDYAINQLLDHPNINSQATPLTTSGSDITAEFDLRVDYVLPSVDLTVTDAAIFSPQGQDPLRRLTSASDHRMVWLDIQDVPESADPRIVLLALSWLIVQMQSKRQRT